MFKDAMRAIALVAVAMREAQLDVEKMRAGAAAGWVTITELADTLAQRHGLPFRTAHHVATAVVREAAEHPETSLGEIIARESATASGRTIALTGVEIARVLSPEHFVAVRRTLGGPAPEIVEIALKVACQRLADDRAHVARRREQLAAADAALNAAVGAL